MTRSIKSRLNRIEKLIVNKESEAWIAIAREDYVTVSFIDSGASVQMTPEEFKEWKTRQPKGDIITVEWAE